MKTIIIAILPLLVASTTYAQSIMIGSPNNGDTLTSGMPTNVQLLFPVRGFFK